MNVYSRSLSFCCVVLAAVPVLLSAQGYHVEFGGDGQGNEVAVLVNDSKTNIEAYFRANRCGPNEDVLGGWSSEDTLAGIDGDFTITSTNGTTSPFDSIPPGKGAEVGNHWCDTSVDAVLFADGTYAGDETVARGLKAWRDGLAARLAEWIEFFHNDRAFIQPLESLRARAHHLSQSDKDNAARYNFDLNAEAGPPPLLQYWMGKDQVDTTVDVWFDTHSYWHVQDAHEVLHMLERWKAKVDRNEASKKLESIFPAISVRSVKTVALTHHE